MTRLVTLKCILFAAATALVLPSAAIAQVKLPETLAWTAYDVGSGGYNQAVAIGNALKNKYGVNLRVLPGTDQMFQVTP